MRGDIKIIMIENDKTGSSLRCLSRVTRRRDRFFSFMDSIKGTTVTHVTIADEQIFRTIVSIDTLENNSLKFPKYDKYLITFIFKLQSDTSIWPKI